MKYIWGCQFAVEIEAENYEDSIQKCWDFIDKNLPDCFDVEGEELFLIEGEEE